MEISNSKKELARIISENGGWREEAGWAAQDKKYAGQINTVGLYVSKPPKPNVGGTYWRGIEANQIATIEHHKLISNWHQTILSSAEYFHLYPAPDADGWIEWNGGEECPVHENVAVHVKFRNGDHNITGMAASRLYWKHDNRFSDIIAYRLHKPEQVKPEFCESVMRSIPEPDTKPTIEQLAANYRNAKDYAGSKRDEASKAKIESDAALSEIEKAIAAIGFAITPIGAVVQEPELVITDWRDLHVGDIVEIVGSENERWLRFKGVELFVSRTGIAECSLAFRNHDGDEWGHSGNTNWRFIRRPEK